jgi:MoaA/NifB/PqqE/SkfB family radical SAM enzyme
MAGSALPLVLPTIEDPHLRFAKYVNFLIGLRERRTRATTLRALPIDATLDPASLCQLSCPYCSVGAGSIQRTRALLEQETHRRMMGDLGEGLFVIWYFNTGEPLLNKRFADMVAENRPREIFSVISTNLSLKLSDQRIDELLTCGLGMISVSLDGATAPSYSKYRVGGDFELVVDNLRRLTQRKRELGLERPLIEWRFLVFEHNQDELELATRMARELEVDLLEFYPGAAPPRAKGDMVQRATRAMPALPLLGPALDRARRDTSTTMRRLLRMTPVYEPSPPPDEQRSLKCDWLYMGTALFPNGSVSPCCVSNDEPNDFGMIEGEATFAEIWNNEKYRRARGLFVEGNGPTAGETPDVICARCPQPASQDYQFRSTMRAVLMNAPDWVLKVLSADPAGFFFDVDFHLSPVELAPLGDGRLDFPTIFPRTLVRLERLVRERPDLEDVVDYLVGCLEAPTRTELERQAAA